MKAPDPYYWDLLDKTGDCVMEQIVEDDDQGPLKEWSLLGWYHHPTAQDIAKDDGKQFSHLRWSNLSMQKLCVGLVINFTILQTRVTMFLLMISLKIIGLKTKQIAVIDKLVSTFQSIISILLLLQMPLHCIFHLFLLRFSHTNFPIFCGQAQTFGSGLQYCLSHYYPGFFSHFPHFHS